VSQGEVSPTAGSRSTPPESGTKVINPLGVPDKAPVFSSERLPPAVLALVLREADLPGAEADPDSDAGDRALPDELLPLIDLAVIPRANDSPEMTAERKRLWERVQKDRVSRARLLSYLARRHLIPESDADDIVSDAYVRMLAAKKWPTDESKSLYPWLRAYTNFTRLRHQRASERREAREQATELIEDYAGEAPEEGDPEARHVAKLNAVEHVATLKPEHAQAHAFIKERAETGEPIRVIARRAGVSPEVAQKRIERFSEAVRRYAVVAGGVFVAIALLVFKQAEPVEHKAGDSVGDHPAPGMPLPDLPDPPPAELRRRALVLCHDGRYEVCLRILDRAKKADRAGDRDPTIVQARADAEKALSAPSPSPSSP